MLAFTFPGQGSQKPGMGAPWADHQSWELVERGVGGRRARRRAPPARRRRRRAASRPATPSSPRSCSAWSCSTRSSGSASSPDWLRRPQPRRVHRAHRHRRARLRRRRAARHRAGRGHAGRRRGATPAPWPPSSGSTTTTSRSPAPRADGDVWVANFNAPGQVVIAGVARGGRRRRRASPRSSAPRRSCRSPVGGAFHTPFMAPGPRPRCARRCAEADLRDARRARRRQRRRPPPHRPRRVGRPARRPAVPPGALAPDAARAWPTRACRRSSSSAPAPSSPAWPSGPCPRCRRLSVSTPDDLDTLLDHLVAIDAADGTALGHGRAPLHPASAWSCAPAPASSPARDLAAGSSIAVGTRLGEVGGDRPRSARRSPAR